jgi:hypothetical protein
MTMTMKRIAVATMLAFTTAMVAPAATFAAAQGQTPAKAASLTVPIVGSGGGGTFNGTFQLQRFASQNGALTAVGILSGTVTSATGVVGTILKTVALPAAVVDPTCAILHLDLGPLDLDLLGLRIQLSRVVLDITAEAGAGNLLGNLLCSVTNLLNPGSLSGSPLGQLSQILNALLALAPKTA